MSNKTPDKVIPITDADKKLRKRPDLQFMSPDGVNTKPDYDRLDLDLSDEVDLLLGDTTEVEVRPEQSNQSLDFRLDFNEQVAEDLLDDLAKHVPAIEQEEEFVEEPVISYKELLAQTRERLADLKIHQETYEVTEVGFESIGTPEDLILKLDKVGYHCAPYLAAQISLCLSIEMESVRSLLLEGAPGVGKSYMAKSLAKVTGAEFMCLSCYQDMNLQHLIEHPSTLGIAKAMAGVVEAEQSALMNLGVISRAFRKSQEKPVILLIDEIDKVDVAIDTFFLGPLQDAKIYLESGDVISANVNNLLIIFTKNYERKINDALLRRVQPITLDFLDSELEKKILEPHCLPQLISNLVKIADVMRYSDSSYKFERPPAPEELLKIGRFLMRLLEWDIIDFAFVGRNVWQMLAKSENDRYVLELMLRYHPDFHDTLRPQGRTLNRQEVYAKLGRLVLQAVVPDAEDAQRKKAYRAEHVGLTNIGTPQDLIRKLSEVKYECMPFLATQVSLLLNSPTEKVRTLMLEGPPGCGKSYLAKSMAKITGAEFMCLSCYSGMNLQYLIEHPSTYALAAAQAGSKDGSKADIMSLGILSRAFLKSRNQPVILLIDEIDKVDIAIDTFFLGPLQDATIYLESRPPIDANVDNLLIVFTKNYVRVLNDALLRRVHPIKLTYLNSTLEKKILKPHCSEQLVNNLVSVVDRMRYSGGSYGFDRPPAPEELLTIAHYINRLIDWGEKDFSTIAKNIWAMLAKSEHDRAVLDHMMRFHPDYLDPLMPDGKIMTADQVYDKLGRILLKDILASGSSRISLSKILPSLS